jgi:hypothetical protein
MKLKNKCRVCNKENLELVMDFGLTPLANAYRKKEDLDKPELFYPLAVNFCSECKNVQLNVVVEPELLFRNYLYKSSTSPVLVKHFEDFAKSIGKVSSVVDIGSNDGILLKPFQDMGVKVLGVEPATNIAKLAPVPTINDFFTLKVAKEIGATELVTCFNCFAHTNEIDEIAEGAKFMIGDTGTFVIEVQYLMDQIKYGYFDNFYHEHVQYWTVTSIDRYFHSRGLFVQDVIHASPNGGSIIVFIKKNGEPKLSVSEFKESEKVLSKDLLIGLKEEVAEKKLKLLRILFDLKKQGKIIAGYGAPAKATTLCSYFGIGSDILDYVVDDSELKQDKYLPSNNLPIYSPERLKQEPPDYILVLAWNFAESIMKNHPGFKFILPLPDPKVYV